MRIADTEEFGNTVLIVTKTESSDDVLAVWVWSRQRRVHFWGRAAVPWGWWFLLGDQVRLDKEKFIFWTKIKFFFFVDMFFGIILLLRKITNYSLNEPKIMVFLWFVVCHPPIKKEGACTTKKHVQQKHQKEGCTCGY